MNGVGRITENKWMRRLRSDLRFVLDLILRSDLRFGPAQNEHLVVRTDGHWPLRASGSCSPLARLAREGENICRASGQCRGLMLMYANWVSFTLSCVLWRQPWHSWPWLFLILTLSPMTLPYIPLTPHRSGSCWRRPVNWPFRSNATLSRSWATRRRTCGSTALWPRSSARLTCASTAWSRASCCTTSARRSASSSAPWCRTSRIPSCRWDAFL